MKFTLQDLQNACENCPNAVIKGFKLTGYGSWRGAYNEPCIYLEEDESSSVGFLEIAKAVYSLTDGTVFHGWKGGEYTYNLDDPMNIEPCPRSDTDGEHQADVFISCPKLFYALFHSAEFNNLG